MNEDILNQIVDDYYSDCPCVDTNQESIETYGNEKIKIDLTSGQNCDIIL